MKKRILTLLTMSALVFSGCQRGVQTQAPLSSEEVKVTSSVTSLETGDIAISREPVVMDVPVTTSPEPTKTLMPTMTEVPTQITSSTPEPTAMPESTAMLMPTVTPKPTASPEPTATPIPTATPKPTATPEPTATPIPTATPKPAATPEPTATPIPTATPKPTAVPTPTEVPSDENLFKYIQDENGDIVITWYSGKESNVVVPSKIDGTKVVSIGERAFYQNQFISRVVLPYGVTTIGMEAFAYSTLEEIVLPDTLRTMEQGVFENCELTEIELPEGLEYLPIWAFLECEKLEKVGIPQSVRYIYDDAFQLCTALEEIDLPGVTYLGDGAFNSCSSLKTVRIEKRYITLDYAPFRGCKSLTNLQIDNVTNYKLIDGVIFSSDGTVLVEYLGSNDRAEYIVPKNVKRIEPRAFQAVKGLEYVCLPELVTEIPKFTFYGCVDLEAVWLEDGIESIGKGAFQMTALDYINLPESLTYLGEQAFSGCKSLLMTEIPDGVTVIEQSTFSGCTSLIGVELPNTLTTIREGAFRDCVSLRRLEIPGSVTEIESRVFYDMPNRKKLEWGGKTPCLIVEGNSDAHRIVKEYNWDYLLKDNYNLKSTDYKTTIYIGWNTELGVYDGDDNLLDVRKWEVSDETIATISNNGMAIGKRAGVVRVTATLMDGTKVERDYEVMDGCAEEDFIYKVLNDGTVQITGYKGRDVVLVIPSKLGGRTVSVIEQYAFEDENFIAVCIPKNVIEVMRGAFLRCRSLERFYVEDYHPVFYTVDGVLFGRNQYVVSMRCDKVLMHYPEGREGTTYSIPEGTTGILGYAFRYMGLQEIRIPDSMMVIGESAFEGTQITEVHIPRNVVIIGGRAFSGCKLLKEIEVSPINSSFCVSDGVLFDEGMEKLVLYPAGKEESSYRVLTGVKEIGEGAFMSALNLRSVYLPEGLRIIDDYAFYSTYLGEIQLPETVQRLGIMALAYCYYIKDITIPASVTTIDSNCFFVTDLMEVYFEHGRGQRVVMDDDVFTSEPLLYGVQGGSAEQHAKKLGYDFVDRE